MRWGCLLSQLVRVGEKPSDWIGHSGLDGFESPPLFVPQRVDGISVGCFDGLITDCQSRDYQGK